MIINKKSNIIYSLLAFTIPFVVYFITLAPSVTFIDSGELATVAAKLGVAHPTGYPLFTIIGNAFTRLPFVDEVFRLNLMCAVFSSLSIMVFFNLLILLSVRILDQMKEVRISEKCASEYLSFRFPDPCILTNFLGHCKRY